MNEIEVYVCMPHNKQEYRKIQNNLEGIKSVGISHFAIFPLFDMLAGYYLVYDDEVYLTKREELDEYRTLWLDTHWILGNCFICKMKGSNMDSLEESDKEKIEAFMKGEKI